jgi:hypothetical protein
MIPAPMNTATVPMSLLKPYWSLRDLARAGRVRALRNLRAPRRAGERLTRAVAVQLDITPVIVCRRRSRPHEAHFSPTRRVLNLMRRPLSGALGLLVVLSLSACGNEKTNTSRTTIRLIATPKSNKVLVDRAPKGVVSTGDVLWSRAILRNAVPQLGKAKGARVGSRVATDRVVASDAGVVKVILTLPGGTIHAGGRVTATPSESIQVTGGTGTYAGARGTGSTRSLYPRNGSLNVYRLHLP